MDDIFNVGDLGSPITLAERLQMVLDENKKLKQELIKLEIINQNYKTLNIHLQEILNKKYKFI